MSPREQCVVFATKICSCHNKISTVGLLQVLVYGESGYRALLTFFQAMFQTMKLAHVYIQVSSLLPQTEYYFVWKMF